MTMEGTHDHSESVTIPPTWYYTYLIPHRQGLAAPAMAVPRIHLPGLLQLVVASGLASYFRHTLQRLAHASRILESIKPVLFVVEPGLRPHEAAEYIRDRSRPSGSLHTFDCSAATERDFDAFIADGRGSVRGSKPTRQRRKTDADTAFMTDIGRLPDDLKARLDRALGGAVASRLEIAKRACRLMAATHCPTGQTNAGEMSLGPLRWKFTYVVPILPLRNAIDLMPGLVDDILASEGIQKTCGVALTSDAQDKLREYDWPGNILQLENVLLRAIDLSHEGRIEAKHILFDGELGGRAAPCRKPRRGRPRKAILDPATLEELRVRNKTGESLRKLAPELSTRLNVQLSHTTLFHMLRRSATP